MLFNFPDRMLGQILVDLSDNACFDVGMECVSQVGEIFWAELRRRGLSPCSREPSAPWSSDSSCKPMLFNVVPFGWLNCTSSACCRGLNDATRPVGDLLVAGRIFILKDLLNPEIGKFLVTFVSQEQFRPSPHIKRPYRFCKSRCERLGRG
jgi:hypothetical protein